MLYTELTIYTTSAASELVADLLWEYTQEGVAIFDKNDLFLLQKNKQLYWDYIDNSLIDERTEQDCPVIMKCFLLPQDAPLQIEEIVNRLHTMQEFVKDSFSCGSLETYTKLVDGDAWLNDWKEHFKPIFIGKNIVICPEWIPFMPKDNQKLILLNANLAFGTGEHETTAMCLEFLEKYCNNGQTLLDVGCGSGILAIAALKLGIKKATLIDIDEIAVQSAKNNAILNDVQERADIFQANLLEDKIEPVNIIVANLTADILLVLSQQVQDALLPNGIVIMSGIIDEKVDCVLETFQKTGLLLLERKKKGEWHAMVWKNGEQ